MHFLLQVEAKRRRGRGGVHGEKVKDKDTEPGEEVFHSELKKQGKKYVYAKLVSRDRLTEKKQLLIQY